MLQLLLLLVPLRHAHAEPRRLGPGLPVHLQNDISGEDGGPCEGEGQAEPETAEAELGAEEGEAESNGQTNHVVGGCRTMLEVS